MKMSCFDQSLVTAFIERNGKFLMFHKKPDVPDEFGVTEGEWGGVTGEQYPRDIIGEVVKREVFERTGLTLQRWKYRAAVEFWDVNRRGKRVCFFYCDKFKGKLLPENEYGTYEWVDKNKVLELSLSRADRIFLKKVIGENRKFLFFQGLFDLKGKYIRAIIDTDNTFVPQSEWDI